MEELPWIAEARRHIGLREDTSRARHNPKILAWLDKMASFDGAARPWWRDDETPWCGLFVGYCLGSVGRYVVREWYRALAWEAEAMLRLEAPAYGCIVTFTRAGGGHVGFVVGRDQRGNLMVLGGNQGNAVSIAPFDRSRVTGCYWPAMFRDGKPAQMRPADHRYKLPLLSSDGKLSTNEA